MQKFITGLQTALVYVVSFASLALCIRAAWYETDFVLKMLYSFCALITTSGFMILVIMTLCFYRENRK